MSADHDAGEPPRSSDAENPRASAGHAARIALRHLIKTALSQANDPPQRHREIGRGGVGTVHEARDPALHRRLAVKSLHRTSYAEPSLVRGFLREALVTGQLDHPNIVSVHRLGYTRELGVYFSMSVVDGESLADLMMRKQNLDYDGLCTYLDILGKVCSALAYAHSRGVVHCDIKPANIMIGEFGQVYLMDWGGARLLSDERLDAGDLADLEDTFESFEALDTVADPLPDLPPQYTENLLFGTPSYMAPEQARGEPVDERTDVFAVGALLYTMVMGRPPFSGATASQRLLRAQECAYRPVDPNVHGGVLPRSLFTIIKKAMARRPADRYQSMNDLREQLISVLNGGGSFPACTFPAGAVVVQQGEDGDSAYIVLDGELEVYQENDGKRMKLRTLGVGDIFGEIAIFASVPRTATVVARTKVALARITAEVIEHELDHMKPWMASLIRVLAQRFHERESMHFGHSNPALASDKKPWWLPW